MPDRKIEITKNKSNRRLMKQKNTHFRLKGLLLYSNNSSYSNNSCVPSRTPNKQICLKLQSFKIF